MSCKIVAENCDHPANMVEPRTPRSSCRTCGERVCTACSDVLVMPHSGRGRACYDCIVDRRPDGAAVVAALKIVRAGYERPTEVAAYAAALGMGLFRGTLIAIGAHVTCTDVTRAGLEMQDPSSCAVVVGQQLLANNEIRYLLNFPDGQRRWAAAAEVSTGSARELVAAGPARRR